MQKHIIELILVGIAIRIAFLKYTHSIVLRSIGHAANEDWNRLKEEVTLFHNPNVQDYSEAVHQPPLFLACWKFIGLNVSEVICLPALECLAFLSFLILDYVLASKSKKISSWYPYSTLVFAFNPFSNISFAAHSVGIISVLIIVWIFIELARDRNASASVLCAIGCYVSIFPGYLMLAVFAQCRQRKTAFISSLFVFSLTLCGLLWCTFLMEGNWKFIDHCYLSNIYALDTTPNMGVFWYMYVEMFNHFNALFVLSMQLIICALGCALLMRFYEDPLFLALMLTMTTGVLRPYNSMADFGCSLAVAAQWLHVVKYMRRIFLLGILIVVALVLAPLFFFTWLQTATSNANFYFATALITAMTRVQIIVQLISGYLRFNFHQKFGDEPILSTGTRVVPSLRA